jgi:Transcriptional regulator, AbiEi antitoxin/Protein of unknown function (DUF559)
MRILRAYRNKSASPGDRELAGLAATQHGVVSRRQLLAAGLSADAIGRRTAAGRLHPVHAGVYAVGHPLLSRHGRWMAAVLACGERAWLSYRSAAALWDLRSVASGPIDVTIPLGGSRRRSGVAVHVTRSLEPDEITTRDGIPCTTPERTLLDLAAVATKRELARSLEQSLVLRIFDRASLDAILGRTTGRRGTGRLRRLVAALADEPPFVRSELERRFLELVAGAGLPAPVVNGLVAGHEVDFHWPAERFVVETDGRATHAHALAFERDRRRDLDLELAGLHVVRTTWHQVVHEPERVTVMLASRLRPSRATRAPRRRRRESATANPRS